MPKAVSVRLLEYMLTYLRYILTMALSRLCKPPAEASYSEDPTSTTTNNNNNEDNYVLLVVDGSSPSLVPVPVPVITAAIKKRLPVVLYGDFLADRTGESELMHEPTEHHRHQHHDEASEEASCAVCWDSIERIDRIRELPNCSHVFHGECLDRWVDEGQVTCPLCRSMLLPAKTNPWLIMREHAHLSAVSPAPAPAEQRREQAT